MPFQSLLPDRGILIAEAAQLVFLFLKDIRVHRSDLHPFVIGELLERFPVIQKIPGDMDGH